MNEQSLGVCIHRIPVEEDCLHCRCENAQHVDAEVPADFSDEDYDEDDFDYIECEHGNPIEECEECVIEEGCELDGGEEDA